MTISSIDEAIAGMQPMRVAIKSIATGAVFGGKFSSTWYQAGHPGGGGGSTSLNGAILSSSGGLIAGQIPYYDAPSGKKNYLAKLIGDCTPAGVLFLMDRLWSNGGFTAVTTAQAITSPTWPARDNNGATDGEGVMIAVEYSNTGANNSPIISINYTNSDGVSGRGATNAIVTNPNPVQGTMLPFGLQSGDKGVRSVQSVTFSAAPTAGSIALVAYRVIAALEIPALFTPNSIDVLTGGMPEFYDGSVPFLTLLQATTTNTQVHAAMTLTQG